jgi:hypothetical protein
VSPFARPVLGTSADFRSFEGFFILLAKGASDSIACDSLAGGRPQVGSVSRQPAELCVQTVGGQRAREREKTQYQVIKSLNSLAQ